MARRVGAQREYQRRHYQGNKGYYKNKRQIRRCLHYDALMRYKATLQCLLCPENCPIALDFHHADPTQKDIEIFRMAYDGRSWAKIVAEIEKCFCLCANCHRKVHKLQEWADKLIGCSLLIVPVEFRTVDVSMARSTTVVQGTHNPQVASSNLAGPTGDI